MINLLHACRASPLVHKPAAPASVDLRHCSTWMKFCELHHDDHTTVVFLCGGGVQVAEVCSYIAAFGHKVVLAWRGVVGGGLESFISRMSGLVRPKSLIYRKNVTLDM